MTALSATLSDFDTLVAGESSERTPEARLEATDEVLMRRFQDGDRTAFTQLVRRYKWGLYNFALHHIRTTHSVAEDIVQETFVRVVQNATSFKHDARFSTWIYAIVRNLCIDHYRWRRLRQHPSLDESRKSDGDGLTLGELTADSRGCVERHATGRELKQRILDAVDALPELQREVFLMRELSNLSFNEISDIQGVCVPTVKNRMRYALGRLRLALSDYED